MGTQKWDLLDHFEDSVHDVVEVEFLYNGLYNSSYKMF